MEYLNRITIIGKVYQAPHEIPHMDINKQLAKVTVKTEDSWMDKQNIRQVRLELHDIAVTGKISNSVLKLKVDDIVYIEGKIQTRKVGNEFKYSIIATKVVKF